MSCYVGIDIGGMSAKCAVLRDEQLYGVSRCKTERDCSAEETAERLVMLVKEVVQKSGVTMQEVAAVGIGSPGIIDSAKGVVVSWTNYNWQNVPLGELIKNKLKKPCCILNDANAAALGEYEYGAGKQYHSAVMITIGTGIGSGIVFDGKIFEGNQGAGGELGHEVIKFGGEKCTCGRRGCFERYASARALIHQTQKAMIIHPESELWRIYNGNTENINGKTVFDGLRLGDRTAKSVLDRYIKYLAAGITNAVNAFRPEAVILGGGISAEGETITKPLQEIVNREKMGGSFSASVQIVTATLGNDAGIYGAAEYARRKAEC